MTRDPFEGQPVLRHDGGPCPVPPETLVRRRRVGMVGWLWPMPAEDLSWIGLAHTEYQIARTEPKPRKWGGWASTEGNARLFDYVPIDGRIEVKWGKDGNLKIRERLENKQ